MDKAREIIREAVILNVTRSPTTKTNAILEALNAAGYRIVGPGDVDAETVKAPADRFARWLEAGPRLAAAAGCYVGIKVTSTPTKSLQERET